MPRLWILSDLHEEIDPDNPWPLLPPDFDVLACAGDVFEGDIRRTVSSVARIAAGRPAVMALGNHDLYGLPIDRAAAVAAKIGREMGVHVLERSAIEIGGLRFAGGTLWDAFELGEGRKPDLTDVLTGTAPAFFSPMPGAPYGEPVDVEDENGIRPATFADIARRRRQTLAAIEAAEADVVLTHYPPTAADLPRAGGATTWIHGHIHTFARSAIDGIDVMVNAAPSRLFAPRMVVEVGPRTRPNPASTCSDEFERERDRSRPLSA